jgi:hypothetical protein
VHIDPNVPGLPQGLACFLIALMGSGCCFGGQVASTEPAIVPTAPAAPTPPWPPTEGRVVCDARGTTSICFEMPIGAFSSAAAARQECVDQGGVFLGGRECDVVANIGQCNNADGTRQFFFPGGQFTRESAESLCRSTGGRWF